MPAFVCTRCGAIDNTALTDYYWNAAHHQPVLCSLCEEGKWHNSFPRKIATKADAKKVLNPEAIVKAACERAERGE